MKYVVLGATGRTGRFIAEGLEKAGHAVTAPGRRDPGIAGVEFRQTDLMDAETVRAAIQGADAVISALASAKGNPVCSTLATALADIDGLRFVTIAGGGVDAPGDNKGFMDKAIGWLMRRLVPEMLADRQREFGILQSSRLRWTVIRPPMLTDKPATGRWQITHDRPASKQIPRADLAAAAIAVTRDDTLVRRAPFVAG